MKTDYFEKVMKVLKTLKKDYPDIEISKHYSLATSEHGDFLSDRELYECLNKHLGELNMNTMNIDVTELEKQTNELFKEVEVEDDWEKSLEEEEEY